MRHGLLRSVAQLYAGEQTIDSISMAYRWIRSRARQSTAAVFAELLERIDKAMKGRDVRFEWVKGHAGHPENERCDRLAVAWYQNYQAGCAAKMSE